VEALDEAELIAIAPSNPFVSIDPILAVRGIRRAVAERRDRVVAVSPLIGGRAVKGPAEDMFRRLQGGAGPEHVTDCYKGMIGALVLDEEDAEGAAAVEARGVRALVTRTLMSEPDARRKLVETVLGLVPA
jgi:LPPG:FO 2-phospho-L-lactate transferase